MGFLGAEHPQAVCGKGLCSSKDRQLLKDTKTLGDCSSTSQSTHHWS